MNGLVSQNLTQDPMVSILFSDAESWTATNENRLPPPISTNAKAVKVFFASDPSNTMEGFSLFLEKWYARNCTACQKGTFKT